MSVRPRSLQGRLVLLVVSFVLVVWLAAAALTWRDAQHELDELLDGHLAQAAALLVIQQAEIEGDDDHETLDAPTLHKYAPRVAFQVFHDGQLTLRSSNAPALPWAPREFTRGFRTVDVDGRAWRVFAARGADRDVQVYVSERVSSRADILWAVLRSMLQPMLFALPVLAIAVWWAIRRGLRPLRSLGAGLAAREPSALEPIVLPDAPAEMVPVLAALNDLFARIGALVASERRFTADAAHELRTPIAAIRAQAQVALGEADRAQRDHALRSVLQGCDRAARLVDQLLTLARVEAGVGPAFVVVDLAESARRVVSELAPSALARQQSIELEADAPCHVQGDPTLLGVLARNLVDNAVRYSPTGARVRVAVLPVAGQVRLVVEDSGAGLSDADIARLGERFFRVLGSGESGSGLGWSIVRRIAAAHRAHIAVHRSATLGGLAVEVEWPTARAAF